MYHSIHPPCPLGLGPIKLRQSLDSNIEVQQPNYTNAHFEGARKYPPSAPEWITVDISLRSKTRFIINNEEFELLVSLFRHLKPGCSGPINIVALALEASFTMAGEQSTCTPGSYHGILGWEY
jgi:hypothetical protein